MEFDIRKAIERAENLPTFSITGQRALRLISEPNVDLQDLGQVISGDQSLTSKLLQVSNSTAFGLPRQVTKVAEALAYIGLDESRRIILVATTHFMFGGTQDFSTWHHAILTAYLAEGLARRSGLAISTHEAYLAGLLHDVGKTFIQKNVPFGYREVIGPLALKMGRLNAELSLFGMDHAEVGSLMMKRWNMVEGVRLAVQAHHNFLDAQRIPIAYAVRTANLIAHLGDKLCSEPNDLSERTIQAFGLQGENALQTLRDEMEKKVSEFQSKIAVLV